MIRTVIKYTDNKILLNDAEVFETSKTLNSGCYDIEFDEYGRFKNFLSVKNPYSFSLMPSKELQNIEEYIEKFLSEEYCFLCKKSKTLIKSGILLYGKPGIGKSNYINHLVLKSLKKNSCVFNINSAAKLYQVIQKLKELKDIQDNLFVIVLEEIDEILSAQGYEAILKNFMDGIDSINNCLFLATTNYIEKIPTSLTERPSRFKKVLKIEQSENLEEVKIWLEKTYLCFIDDLTTKDFEFLHEKCLNKPIDEIKHILIDYKMEIKSFENKKQKLGFSNGK
tara:strand:+ start:1816 stop:2658 length:843 start_codon:yes stop_codon:yes gene_type:complete